MRQFWRISAALLGVGSLLGAPREEAEFEAIARAGGARIEAKARASKPARQRRRGEGERPTARMRQMIARVEMPADFWTVSPRAAATAWTKVNVRTPSGLQIPFVNPVAALPPVPEAGSAVLLGRQEMWPDQATLVRWSGQTATWYRLGQPGGEGTCVARLAAARWRHVLEVSQLLLRGEFQFPPKPEDEPTIVLVGGGLRRMLLHAEGDAPEAKALALNLVLGLWQYVLEMESQLPGAELKQPPLGRERHHLEQDEAALRWVCQHFAPALQPPGNEAVLQFGSCLAGRLADRPIAQGAGILAQFRQLLTGNAAAREFLPTVEKAELRWRLSQSPEELANLMVQATAEAWSDPCADCAWAAKYVHGLDEVRRLPVLQLVFPKLSLELQRQTIWHFVGSSPAAAEQAVQEVVNRSGVGARDLAAEFAIALACQAGDPPRKAERLLAALSDREVEPDLRVKILQMIAPTNGAPPVEGPAVDATLLALLQPTTEKAVLLELLRVLSERPVPGAFAAVAALWRESIFPTSTDKARALLALGGSFDQAGPAEKRWLRERLQEALRGDSSLVLAAAWLVEAWDLAPAVRGFRDRATDGGTRKLAERWLAAQAASPVCRVMIGLMGTGHSGMIALPWPELASRPLESWLRRAASRLSPSDQMRLRKFTEWADGHIHGGLANVLPE